MSNKINQGMKDCKSLTPIGTGCKKGYFAGSVICTKECPDYEAAGGAMKQFKIFVPESYVNEMGNKFNRAEIHELIQNHAIWLDYRIKYKGLSEYVLLWDDGDVLACSGEHVEKSTQSLNGFKEIPWQDFIKLRLSDVLDNNPVDSPVELQEKLNAGTFEIFKKERKELAREILLKIIDIKYPISKKYDRSDVMHAFKYADEFLEQADEV